MKWSCTSKLQIPKLNPVELPPLSFWSKSLLPKVDHGEQERVGGTYVVILRLTRGREELVLSRSGSRKCMWVEEESAQPWK